MLDLAVSNALPAFCRQWTYGSTSRPTTSQRVWPSPSHARKETTSSPSLRSAIDKETGHWRWWCRQLHRFFGAGRRYTRGLWWAAAAAWQFTPLHYQHDSSTDAISHRTLGRYPVKMAGRFSLNCENCDHSNVLKTVDVCKMQRQAFVLAVQRSDAQCFYYTGVLTVALLLYIFSWLKASAQNVKLWDGSRKGLPR